jgi:hypothetical protein
MPIKILIYLIGAASGFFLSDFSYSKSQYWLDLTAFLDKRDDAIFKRVRQNQDHKFPNRPDR